jgi:hypothetical protein
VNGKRVRFLPFHLNQSFFYFSIKDALFLRKPLLERLRNRGSFSFPFLLPEGGVYDEGSIQFLVRRHKNAFLIKIVQRFVDKKRVLTKPVKIEETVFFGMLDSFYSALLRELKRKKLFAGFEKSVKDLEKKSKKNRVNLDEYFD